QIVGRGTRLFDGKEFFTILDFVNAYKHFNDPEWDGEPIDETVEKEPKELKTDSEFVEKEEKETDDEAKTRPKKIKIKLRDGKEREIQHMISTSFWSADGKPISAEEFLQSLYGKLPSLFTSEAELRQIWSNPTTRKAFLQRIAELG
ncbi:MAG: restriction endonuclease subunit R, partial [Candidatus Peregrinibacteria bacterium]|nr:restriction endonuclease subunit R [Candidatus Peregrinibacteria bacterium]